MTASRAVAALLAAALLAAGCGGTGAPRLLTETVGSGPQTATIIRPDVGGRLPVVVFLHGWGATRPRYYRPWLEHLAREGNAVIYPRYQDSFVEPPPQVLGNMLAGVRRALGHIDEDPRSLVVAGHSAGGALAADYAAIARSVTLPVPVAVFSAYPGRTLEGVPFGIPEVDPRRIPAATRVVALAGTRDRVVGMRPARRLARLAGARRRSLVVVSDPAASDHLGPQRADAAARREFWARLDRLIDAFASGAGRRRRGSRSRGWRRIRSPPARRRPPGAARRGGRGSTPATVRAKYGASAASIASDECRPAWSARQSPWPPCSRYQRSVGSSTTSQACSCSRSRPPGASRRAIFPTAAGRSWMWCSERFATTASNGPGSSSSSSDTCRNGSPAGARGSIASTSCPSRAIA